MQDLIFLILFLKKNDAVELGGNKKGQKRTQIQYIKMSHNRLMIAVKIREKVIFLEHHFSIT